SSFNCSTSNNNCSTKFIINSLLSAANFLPEGVKKSSNISKRHFAFCITCSHPFPVVKALKAILRIPTAPIISRPSAS
ncbi:MAG: hypothetical protein ACFFBD_27640, partial [Candidatus Hodarchaeota archaeon]